MSTPFDLNYCFPVRELENTLVKLTPFNPEIYAESLVAATIDHPRTWDRTFFGPWVDAADFVETFVQPRISNPTNVLFAILDRTKDDAFAGMVALQYTSEDWAVVEVGTITTFPAFRRSHVTSNAIGLLLQYTLDAPDPSWTPPPGSPSFVNSANSEAPVSALGLRRVVWQTQPANASSIRAAISMGLKQEGISQWFAIMPDGKGKLGDEIPSGDKRRGMAGPGVHMTTLSVSWEEWKAGSREIALKAMELRVPLAATT